MHPDTTTVLDIIEQVIPDMQRELPAYLAAAKGAPNIKYWNGGISRKNCHIEQQPAS